MARTNLPLLASSDNADITARLRALQADRCAAAPSEDLVRARLDKLRGQQPPAPASEAPAPVYQPPDTRPNIERSADLLAAVRAEVDLESRVPILTPEQDIERRLAKLRGEQFSSANRESARAQPDNTPDPQSFLSTQADRTKEGYKDLENLDLDEVNKLMQEVNFKMEDEAKAALNDLEKDKVIQEQLARLKVKQNKEQSEKEVNSSDEDNEEEQTDKVLMHILAEARLEERLSPPDNLSQDVRPSMGHGQAEPEELPWCVICNDDASVRCQDCGGDLYCGQCFKELHRDPEERRHRAVGYRK